MERLIRLPEGPAPPMGSNAEPDALPAWAKEHAASWLADLGARWHHVRGVARRAQRISQALAPQDRPYLVAAAWLHDIGYAPSLAATAFHPLDGARHLRALGHERLAQLVAYHSSARWEAEALGLSDDLAVFPREDSATADALTYCDMTTSPTGQRVTLRIAWPRSPAVRRRASGRPLPATRPRPLAGAVRRTEERLRASPACPSSEAIAGAGPCSRKCLMRSRIDSCIGSSSIACGAIQRTSVDSSLTDSWPPTSRAAKHRLNSLPSRYRRPAMTWPVRLDLVGVEADDDVDWLVAW